MRNSLEVFRRFLTTRMDGSVDASHILSRECYLAWLALRRDTESKASAKRFQRTLSNHLGGVDGRAPFDPNEEQAILKEVRRKLRWPCFSEEITVGCTGYRSKGFHERTHTPFKQRIKGLEGIKFTDRDFITNLEYTVTRIIASHHGFTCEAYIEVGTLLRFVFFARTPACSMPAPSVEYAKALCNRVSLTNPGELVLILNLSARNYLLGLCIAQNQLGELQFDNLETREITLPPWHENDSTRVIYAVLGALHQPGEVFHAQGGPVRITCKDGIQRPFTATYTIDTESYLLILRATPATEAPSVAVAAAVADCSSISF